MSSPDATLLRKQLRRQISDLRRQAKKDRTQMMREPRHHMAMLYLGMAEGADDAARRLEYLLEGVSR